jgi:hypothetical protein
MFHKVGDAIPSIVARSQDASTYEEPIPQSLRAHVWCWTLRLILPLLAALLGLALYWECFDGPVGTGWNVVGGLPLCIGNVMILVWGASAWLRPYPI